MQLSLTQTPVLGSKSINHFEISPVFVEEPIPNVPDFAKVRSIKRLIGVNIIRKPSSE